jgi:hypothetical protein
MAMSIFWFVVQLAIAAYSYSYSVQQAKKQREAAKKAAEARRGFEMPVEGEAIFLPLVYGKAKIGGARVWHAVKSDFSVPGNYYPPNGNLTAQKTFLSGGGTEGIVMSWEAAGRGVRYTESPTGQVTMATSWTGKKNQYLYFQQALCQAPIYNVVDVIIDDARYINDPSLGTNLYDEIGDNFAGIYAGFRADMHYWGGQQDGLLEINFRDRATATFNNIAYASCAVALNRTNPQFQGVPQCQFLIEGKMINKLVNYGPGDYNWEGVWSYSNNPVWVLLDYLCDSITGRGLPLTDINTQSFYEAAQICNQTIQTGVNVGGKFYVPTDGSRDIHTRDLPLYECNIIIDPRKPIRENIEGILATMGDARLIWSQGQYKLQLQYVTDNSQLNLAGTLTDNELILDQDVEIKWPGASERLNFCTVRFSNECENFKEDTASWPPKLNIGSSNYLTEPAVTRTQLEGFGGFRYPHGECSSGWSDEHEGAFLLNNYGVWSGNSSTIAIEFIFIIRKEIAGNFRIEYTGDDKIRFEIRDYFTNTLVATSNGWRDNWKNAEELNNVSLGDVSSPEEDRVDKAYRMILEGNDDSSIDEDTEMAKGRAIALRILRDGVVYWGTRDVTYTSVGNRTYNNAQYKTYLTEDNGLELEDEIYAEGITDYYHALAKAEEIVRASRGAAILKLKGYIVDRIYEPGDYIKIESETLNLGIPPDDLYFRVEAFKLFEDFTYEMTLTRFDASFFAWNTKDSEPPYSPPPMYDAAIPAPSYLNYIIPTTPEEFQSSGRLEWNRVDYTDFECYIIYMCTGDEWINTAARPPFREIGRTTATFFTLPPINSTEAFFAIRTKARAGGMSKMTFANTSYDQLLQEYTINAYNINRPWLDGNGDLIFRPTGEMLNTAYVNINGSNVLISDIAANSLVPSLNFVGEYAEAPTQVQVEAAGYTWAQNAVYRNTGDGNSYVLTGDPLGWLLYLESGSSFDLRIESTNGTIFRVGQATTTDLQARVFKNGAEITAETPASWFRWRRVSMSNPAPPNDDATFNATYFAGYKQITVNVDQVNARATFFCDIISP